VAKILLSDIKLVDFCSVNNFSTIHVYNRRMLMLWKTLKNGHTKSISDLVLQL